MDGQFWCVYMLQSIDPPGHWYVGLTEDLAVRQIEAQQESNSHEPRRPASDHHRTAEHLEKRLPLLVRQSRHDGFNDRVGR